jgi:SPP1 gp7 family putative phage head morphogenesis protein
MDGILQVDRHHAAVLVQTSVADVAAKARELVYGKNEDLVKSVQWVATLDARTCEECMGYDGQTFKVDDGPRPPAHANCRCTTVPVLKSWREMGVDLDEFEGARASLDGQVADTVTYGTWLKGQPMAVVREALGATRARLFMDGGLTVDRFTDRFGRSLTLAQLKVRNAKAFTAAGVKLGEFGLPIGTN